MHPNLKNYRQSWLYTVAQDVNGMKVNEVIEDADDHGRLKLPPLKKLFWIYGQRNLVKANIELYKRKIVIP